MTNVIIFFITTISLLIFVVIGWNLRSMMHYKKAVKDLKVGDKYTITIEEDEFLFEKTEILERVKNNYYTAFKILDKLTEKNICIASIDASLSEDEVFSIAFRLINEYLTFDAAFIQSLYSESYNKDLKKINIVNV